MHVGRGGERRLGREAQLVLVVDDAFAEGDRGDMPLTHRAHRHQDTLRPRLDAGLVEMRHRRRIHQRGRGITVFVAEIGADQLTLLVADLRSVQLQQIFDLVVTGHEDAPRLPMPRLEILQHGFQLVAGFLRRHGQDLADQPLGAAGRCTVAAAPGNMKRPHHDARRVGMKPQPVVEKIHRATVSPLYLKRSSHPRNMTACQAM